VIWFNVVGNLEPEAGFPRQQGEQGVDANLGDEQTGKGREQVETQAHAGDCADCGAEGIDGNPTVYLRVAEKRPTPPIWREAAINKASRLCIEIPQCDELKKIGARKRLPFF